MQTYVISTRLNKGLYQLITTESEKLNYSNSEFVRVVFRDYFDERQREDRLDVLEKRLTEKLETQSQRVEKMLQQIVSMAQN